MFKWLRREEGRRDLGGLGLGGGAVEESTAGEEGKRGSKKEEWMDGTVTYTWCKCVLAQC